VLKTLRILLANPKVFVFIALIRDFGVGVTSEAPLTEWWTLVPWHASEAGLFSNIYYIKFLCSKKLLSRAYRQSKML